MEICMKGLRTSWPASWLQTVSWAGRQGPSWRCWIWSTRVWGGYQDKARLAAMVQTVISQEVWVQDGEQTTIALHRIASWLTRRRREGIIWSSMRRLRWHSPRSFNLTTQGFDSDTIVRIFLQQFVLVTNKTPNKQNLEQIHFITSLLIN